MEEQIPLGSFVTSLSSVDINSGDTFTYRFDTTCAGVLDNNKFSLTGNTLSTDYYFTYASQTVANICLKTTDQAGLSYTGLYTINIFPNVPPIGRALSEVDMNFPSQAPSTYVYALAVAPNSAVYAG